MKRIILSSLLTLASLVAISSCQKELDGPGKDVKSPGVKLVINAGTPEVKSFMEYDAANSQYLPKWHRNDALGVFIDSWEPGASAVNGTLANGLDDGEKAQFSGNISADNGSHKAYAFYPARAYYASEASKIVDLEIPYIQFPTASSFDPKADILVSVPKDFEVTEGTVSQMDMQFSRIGAILKVTLNDQTSVLSGDKIKSVKLETCDAVLTGAIRYNFENQAIPSTPMVSTYSNKYVTADFSESPMAIEGNAIFFVVNPVTLAAGSTLTVTVLTDKHEIVKTISNLPEILLESGKLRPLKINLRNTDSIERVYFKDTFDWLYKYIDDLTHTTGGVTYKYGTAYDNAQLITDPVSSSTASHPQPNVWSKFSNTVGTAFNDLGYVDKNSDNEVLYVQENYLKIGASGKQTGIQLPPIDFGNNPVNVTLSFRWCRHMSGAGNIDTVPLVVELLNQGKCADTDATTSNVFTTTQSTSSLLWTEASVVLKNVTNATRIVFKENYDNYTESGVHRFHLDDIKITEAAPTPAEFPIVWSFPEESSTWVKGQDFYLHEHSGTGTYVYSDNHSGKVSVVRAGTSNSLGTATYISRGGVTFEGSTLPDEVQLLTYGMGPGEAGNIAKDGSYWLFEIPNVMNPAGTYSITYKSCASGGGPKYFRLEYTLDDNWSSPIAIEATNTVRYAYDDDSSDLVSYTYATPSNNEAVLVNYSFHIDDISSLSPLKIRAMVVSRINCKQDGNVAVNTTGTNRILGIPTISFTPDTP